MHDSGEGTKRLTYNKGVQKQAVKRQDKQYKYIYISKNKYFVIICMRILWCELLVNADSMSEIIQLLPFYYKIMNEYNRYELRSVNDSNLFLIL